MFDEKKNVENTGKHKEEKHKGASNPTSRRESIWYFWYIEMES